MRTEESTKLNNFFRGFKFSCFCDKDLFVLSLLHLKDYARVMIYRKVPWLCEGGPPHDVGRW